MNRTLFRHLRFGIFVAAFALVAGGHAAGVAGQDSLNKNEAESIDRTWEDYLDLIEKSNLINQYSTTQVSDQVSTQYMFMALAQAYANIYAADPDYPEFMPFINHVFNIAGPNPDATYYFVALDASNSYRILGNRGTVHIVDFQTGYDWLGFSDKPGRAFPSKSIDDFKIEKDGSFEIILSSVRPASYDGNWMELDKRANYMLVRQVANDPREVNARLAIERAGPISKRARSAEDIDKKLRDTISFAKNSTRLYLELIKDVAEANIINAFQPDDPSSYGGVNKQIYHRGLYEVGLNEALLVTVKVPDVCKYWNIDVTDRLWQSQEMAYSQSHLNGHKDRSDGDGLTRFVLSHQDPGVANWIDLGGVEKGYMNMRWLECNTIPEPTVKKIPFNQIMENLPGDTRMVSGEERQLQLHERAVNRQLRRNW